MSKSIYLILAALLGMCPYAYAQTHTDEAGSMTVSPSGKKQMAAYCIFDIREVFDPQKMKKYRQFVGQTVKKFHGRFLVTGGRIDLVEGNWAPVFPVIIRFPSLEIAHRWYDSGEYRELKALRLAATRSNAVFIEGL